MLVRVVPAEFPRDLAVVRELFREYERALGLDLSFQGFGDELATLPGAYAPPRGRLLLATERDDAIGCIALRPLGDDLCEMKRLYLRSSARGKGVGRTLGNRILAEAAAIGYRAMRLDTLPIMPEARALYVSLGFVPIAPYNDNPLPGVLHLERVLTQVNRT